MGNLWSRGRARSALMGHEKTSNPTPAAARLLGKRTVARYERIAKKRRRRKFYKGNPLPAVAGLLGSLGKIGGVTLQSRGSIDQARFAEIDAIAQRVLLNDASAMAELEHKATGSATAKRRDYAKGRLAEVRAALAAKEAERARDEAARAAQAKASRAAAQREERAARGAREQSYLTAASDVAGSLGSAIAMRGRSVRQPTRRRKKRTTTRRTRF